MKIKRLSLILFLCVSISSVGLVGCGAGAHIGPVGASGHVG